MRDSRGGAAQPICVGTPAKGSPTHSRRLPAQAVIARSETVRGCQRNHFRRNADGAADARRSGFAETPRCGRVGPNKSFRERRRRRNS
jgi:hypothetical protein